MCLQAEEPAAFPALAASEGERGSRGGKVGNREALSVRSKLTQSERKRGRTPSGFDYSGGEVQARRGDRAAFIFGTFGDSVIDLYFSPASFE